MISAKTGGIFLADDAFSDLIMENNNGRYRDIYDVFHT